MRFAVYYLISATNCSVREYTSHSILLKEKNIVTVVAGGGGSEVLTSLSVSCAICPDGLTSKLLDSSDFLPPLQLTKLTTATSRSKEKRFSFEAMVQVGVVKKYTRYSRRCARYSAAAP